MNKKIVYGVLYIIFLLIIKNFTNSNNIIIEKEGETNLSYTNDLFNKDLAIEKSISYNTLENNISLKNIDFKNNRIKKEKTIIFLEDNIPINIDEIIETEFIPIINESILGEQFFFEEDINYVEEKEIESFLLNFTINLKDVLLKHLFLSFF